MMADVLELLQNLWWFLPFGYVLTIAIETPILCAGLSAQHPLSRRIFAGVWLTACTYPVVIIVIPHFIAVDEQYLTYVLVAEFVAHFGECSLFYLAFRPLTHPVRDMVVVFGANLASFLFGIALWSCLGVSG